MAGELYGVQCDQAYMSAKNAVKNFGFNMRIQHNVQVKVLGEQPLSYSDGFAKNYRDRLFISAGINNADESMLTEPLLVDNGDEFVLRLPALIRGSATAEVYQAVNIVAYVKKITNYTRQLSVSYITGTSVIGTHEFTWVNEAKETKKYQI